VNDARSARTFSNLTYKSIIYNYINVIVVPVPSGFPVAVDLSLFSKTHQHDLRKLAVISSGCHKSPLIRMVAAGDPTPIPTVQAASAPTPSRKKPSTPRTIPRKAQSPTQSPVPHTDPPPPSRPPALNPIQTIPPLCSTSHARGASSPKRGCR